MSDTSPHFEPSNAETASAEVPATYPEGTVVRFKHESDLDGQPVGPYGVVRPGEETARRYDPNAVPAPWTTRSDAKRFAYDLGLPLIES